MFNWLKYFFGKKPKNVQQVGLNKWAMGLVSSAFITTGKVDKFYSEISGDTYWLKAYNLFPFPDDKYGIYFEKVQAEKWSSSGLVIFLALQEYGHNLKMEWVVKSLWSEEEIETALNH